MHSLKARWEKYADVQAEGSVVGGLQCFSVTGDLHHELPLS